MLKRQGTELAEVRVALVGAQEAERAMSRELAGCKAALVSTRSDLDHAKRAGQVVNTAASIAITHLMQLFVCAEFH